MVNAQAAIKMQRNVISKTITYGRQQIFRHFHVADFAEKEGGGI